MLKLLFILSAIISLSIAGVYPNYRYDFDFIPINDKNDDWWRTANFYQIYPRSFQDSNGDGTGDLNGITERLPYLKEIGITATWLSPIFKSPMKDFGYDISNYYEIDPIFGTMDDFKKLLKRAKELDIKIILDFVPNHSSDKCEWFQKSIDKDPEYKDFYVWHPGRVDPNNKNKRLPPSNWVSVFRGSAWEWNEKRKEYYLHQFVAGQPDFNFRNEKVREKLADVLKFWLSIGVSGFRVDAVPHVYECDKDKDGNFIDEPRNEGVTDPDDYGYLKHVCTTDQPETIQLVYEWRKVLDDFQKANQTETKVLMTESYSPLDILMKYYGNATVKGAHIPFNFLMISTISNSSNAKDYARTINDWLSKMSDDRTPNWVIGNHDKSRVGTRLGNDRIDTMNMITMTLPGIAVTYQGEEIGMTDVWISWDDTLDPSACNSNKDIYQNFTRDPERTPFQWDDSKNAGFSTAEKTWLPVGDLFGFINVKLERMIGRSHLNVYKQLRALRNAGAFKDNKVAEVKAYNDNVLIILRSQADQHFVTLANINDSIENVNLLSLFKKLPPTLKYIIVGDHSPHRIGDQIPTNDILLLPKESVVLSTVQTLLSNDGYYKYDLN